MLRVRRPFRYWARTRLWHGRHQAKSMWRNGTKRSNFPYRASGGSARGVHVMLTSAQRTPDVLAPPPEDQPEYKNQQEESANPASHRGTTIIVAATAAKKDQQDQNDQTVSGCT
jgi:hypothetical protein